MTCGNSCRGETVAVKMATAIAFAQENKERFVEELKALLRIPSVSTAPEHGGRAKSRGVCCDGAEKDWDGECSSD